MEQTLIKASPEEYVEFLQRLDIAPMPNERLRRLGIKNDITTREPINEQHNIQGFNSGEESLDVWLKTKAIKNQKANASRTYVASDNERVIA